MRAIQEKLAHQAHRLSNLAPLPVLLGKHTLLFSAHVGCRGGQHDAL